MAVVLAVAESRLPLRVFGVNTTESLCVHCMKGFGPQRHSGSVPHRFEATACTATHSPDPVSPKPDEGLTGRFSSQRAREIAVELTHADACAAIRVHLLKRGFELLLALAFAHMVHAQGGADRFILAQSDQ